MTKRSRYLLLFAGFVVFIILAPLIILYVRGITYDKASGAFVTTGILAVRTEPKNVDVFLNGNLKRKSAGDIRFVLPGDYQIALKRDGYQTWNKRLNVESGQLTWASPSFGSIYLLLQNPIQKNLDTSVVDFKTQGNALSYLTTNNFVLTSVSHPETRQSFPLPKVVNKILALDESSKNFVLGQNATNSAVSILIFNGAAGKFSDISLLFNTMPEFKFSGNDLYALLTGNLYKIDSAKNTKQLVFKNVLGYYFQNSDLYLISQTTSATSSQTQIQISQGPVFRDTQTLLNYLPNFIQAQIFVTYEKKIFVLGDNALYLANSFMEKLADNINESSFNDQDSILSILHSGQLDYYNGNNLNFVTRSSETLSNIEIKTAIDYALFQKNNQLTAIELDTRDNQNQYVLYSGKNLQKFTIDSSGKNVLLLDNEVLKSLVIR